MRLRLPVVLLAGVVALLAVGVAQADGEAGLVIQEGESVRTYCVAFEGESVRGDQLLTLAGLRFDQFGGSARTLCSIGGTGCFDSSSFDSCFCKCQSGGGDCTYWAFFTQRYGAPWTYSVVGFNLASARDGDLHGWRWGKGSLQSAPPPGSISFDQICGHAPRGGSQVTTTATPPAPTAVITAALSPSASTGGSTTTTPATSSPTHPVSPGLSPSLTTSPPETATEPGGPETSSGSPSPTVVVTMRSQPESAVDGADDDSGGSTTALIAFGGVAGLMGVAILLAVVRRRSHGG